MCTEVINDWIKEVCYHNKKYNQWALAIVKNLQSKVKEREIEDASSLWWSNAQQYMSMLKETHSWILL